LNQPPFLFAFLSEVFSLVKAFVHLNMPAQNINIRIATDDDAETIALLSRRTFYDTFGPYNTSVNMEKFMHEQFTHSSLVKEVKFPTNQFLLAYAGDTLAGYVKLRDGEKPKEIGELQALEIARIYVVSEMIGKGVGRQLMQHSVYIANQKNKQVIWLAVWEKNKRAFEFYLKWGFEIFNSQVFVLGNDVQKDWVMKKNLTPDPSPLKGEG